MVVMRRLPLRFLCASAIAAALFLVGREASAADLPPAVSRVAGVDLDNLVSVVTADIDADGDLDVVASDTALGLHVWVNDGAGHFTPREPMRSPTWERLPDAPRVDARQDEQVSFTGSSPPSVSLVWRVIGFSSTGSIAFPTSPTRRSSVLDRSARTPRAPPIA